MANATNGDTGWTERGRPANLSKRFVFTSYAENRDFLDRVATLSEQTGIHPDISFGRDYANLAINPMESDALSDVEREFAARIDAVLDPAG